MTKVEVKLPVFAYSRKNPENPCPCEDRPKDLTYKVSQIFWQVADGDRVRKDDPIAGLECEKKTLELLSPASGTLEQVVEDGDEVDINTLLGIIH
ncbi:MAG: lipoyl domain-containing protein [Eubacteriales bacterium]|nr:lipoyl domain-containing protein [Eubacteriales bacterium]